MAKNKDFENQLEKEMKKLEKQIKHPKLSNLKIYAKQAFLKTGRIIRYVAPFLASSMIIQASLPNLLKNEEVPEYAKKERTVTSTGLEKEFSSFNNKNNKNLLQYSTAWCINDKGLYERIVTTYSFDELEKESEETLLSLSASELDKFFSIADVELIQKNILTEEDKIYEEDMVIITTTSLDKQNVRYRKQSSIEEFGDMIIYMILIVINVFLLKGVKRIFIGPTLENKLEITDKELSCLRNKGLREKNMILQLQRENLRLFGEFDKKEKRK